MKMNKISKYFKIISTFLFITGSLCAQTIGKIPNVYRASDTGAKLDCIIAGKNPNGTSNINAGKQIGTLGTCTNNDIILNGILALATPTNPITLILDGPTITGGLVGPSTGNWTIDCLNEGNGLYMAPGANSHMVRNIPAKNGYNILQSPINPGQNISIKNCYFNGNRGDGTTGNSNSGTARQDSSGHWLFGIYLDNMRGVQIQNVSIYNSPSFQLLLNSCKDCDILSTKIDENFPNDTNQDGVHVDGPSSNIKISNLTINSNDDAIALNASEGYAGPIDGVSIDGEYCNTCISALRILSDEDAAGINDAVTNVTYTNGTGYIQDSGHSSLGVFVIGYQHSNSSNLDLMGPIHISNSTFTTLSTGTPYVNFADNASIISLDNMTWNAPAGPQPWFTFNQASTISNLTCNSCRIYRNTTGHAAAYWAQVPSGSTIKRFECTACAVLNEQGQSYAALNYAIDVPSGGLITALIPGFDPILTPILLNGNQFTRVGIQTPIISTIDNSITASSLGSHAICALHTDAGCLNSVTDATTANCPPGTLTATCTFPIFQTIPANSLGNNLTMLNLNIGLLTTAVIPSIYVEIFLDSTRVLTGSSTTAPGPGMHATTISCSFSTLAVGSSSPLAFTCNGNSSFANSIFTNTLLSNTAPAILIDTTISHLLKISISFSSAVTGNLAWLYGTRFQP